MRAATLVLAGALCAGAALPATRESRSFSEGRELAAQRGAALLVLVHGSDWHPFGERLFEEVWLDGGLAAAAGEGAVLADVDVLQSAEGEARDANEERNRGWDKKASGLLTYPAVIAYAPDGTPLGARQGRDLPRDLEGARATILELAGTCRAWLQLERERETARALGDAGRELDILMARDRLPLRRAADLLDEVRRLDPKDRAGHLARLTFPAWNALVKGATDEAQAGAGAAAEERLLAMLASDAYTDEQRAAIHLALGSAYRRWEGHAEQAAASLRRAWEQAPDSVCGHAGRRLYLDLYGPPSIELGWKERHAATPAGDWLVEDLPARLEPGAWRLRLERTRGGELHVEEVQLIAGGKTRVVHTGAAALTRTRATADFEFSLREELTDATLRISIRRDDGTRGRLEWRRLD